jgi:hypothetical protein
MNILILVVSIIGGVFLLGGGIFLYFYMKKGGKYPFLLYSRNGKQITQLNAILKTDPENSARKQFFIDTIGFSFDVKSPSKWIGQTAYREIIQTESGDYAYIKGTEIDEKDYIKVSLQPEEKIIALNRYKENKRRYTNPISKGMAGLLVGSLILAFILIVGIVYSVASYAGAAKDMAELAKENTKNGAIIQQTSNNAKIITEQLVMVTAALTENYNITRTIG